MLMILFNAIVCVMAGWYAMKFFEEERNFMGWFSIFVSALNAAVVAANIF